MPNISMSHTRRHCREWALQLLFQFDFQKPDSMDEVFSQFWADKPQVDERAREFTRNMILGVRANLAEIDMTISGVSSHWDIERMGGIDRNVIRMAAYEMLFRDDVPDAVSINEAVDLANYFSNEDSGRFVNGVLDKIRSNHCKAQPAAARPSSGSPK